MSKVGDILETMDYGPAPEEAKVAIAWIASHGFARFESRVTGDICLYAASHWHSSNWCRARLLLQTSTHAITGS